MPPVPLPVDPSEEASDDPSDDVNDAVLLALVCCPFWLLLLLCVRVAGIKPMPSCCSSSMANSLCSFSSCCRCWNRAYSNTKRTRVSYVQLTQFNLNLNLNAEFDLLEQIDRFSHLVFVIKRNHKFEKKFQKDSREMLFTT